MGEANRRSLRTFAKMCSRQLLVSGKPLHRSRYTHTTSAHIRQKSSGFSGADTVTVGPVGDVEWTSSLPTLPCGEVPSESLLDAFGDET